MRRMKMTKLRSYLFLLVSLFVANSAAYAADEVVVIINSANTQQLTKEDIKNIYSDNITTWQSGTKIQVYNTQVSSYIREIFSQHVLGLNAYQASATEANKKITNTLKNPSQIKRERLVAANVARKTNAIGYVSKAVADKKAGIRIVLTIADD